MTSSDILLMETKRAEILNIFSALFCQPEEEITKNPEIYQVLKTGFEIIDPDCVKHVQKMIGYSEKYSLEELLVEYARLFVGPFKIMVPPYSSLYFGDKTLMSNVSIWVLEYYKQAGLNFDRNVKDLPDHIAVETEFLYYLLFNKIKEWEEGNYENMGKLHDLLVYFVNNHYRKWVPEFCNRVIEKTHNGFYKSMATCFEKFARTWVISELKPDKKVVK